MCVNVLYCDGRCPECVARAEARRRIRAMPGVSSDAVPCEGCDSICGPEQWKQRRKCCPDCTCLPQYTCEACLSSTGGSCREHQEPECTCYEITGGHMPGCAFNRPPAPWQPKREGESG